MKATLSAFVHCPAVHAGGRPGKSTPCMSRAAAQALVVPQRHAGVLSQNANRRITCALFSQIAHISSKYRANLKQCSRWCLKRRRLGAVLRRCRWRRREPRALCLQHAAVPAHARILEHSMRLYPTAGPGGVHDPPLSLSRPRCRGSSFTQARDAEDIEPPSPKPGMPKT